MNDLTPNYLLPFVLSGTVATVAAVPLGLHRALKLAGWSTRAVAILVRILSDGARRDSYHSIWSPDPNPCGSGAILAVGLIQARGRSSTSTVDRERAGLQNVGDDLSRASCGAPSAGCVCLARRRRRRHCRTACAGRRHRLCIQVA